MPQDPNPENIYPWVHSENDGSQGSSVFLSGLCCNHMRSHIPPVGIWALMLGGTLVSTQAIFSAPLSVHFPSLSTH